MIVNFNCIPKSNNLATTCSEVIALPAWKSHFFHTILISVTKLKRLIRHNKFLITVIIVYPNSLHRDNNLTQFEIVI